MFIIGYNIELVTDWTTLVDPPARGNMLPATYEAKLPELWAKKAESIREDLTFDAHRITGFSVLNRSTNRLSSDPQKFLDSLSEELATGNYPVLVLGHHSHRLIKKLMWDRIRHNLSGAGQPLPVDGRLWMDDTGNNRPLVVAVDPYRMSGAETHDVSFSRWLRALGITVDQSWNSVPAENQVDIMTRVATAMGL